MQDDPHPPAPTTPDQYRAGVDLLDSEQLGRFLGLGNEKNPGSAARAIRSRIERHHPLPPCISVPGMRRRLWRRCTVERWLASYEGPVHRSRGGRPRKLDLLAMGRAKASREPGSDTVP
jgi:hypothetical protein